METYKATADTISHLAHLVHQQRPDWDVFLVRVILDAHSHQVAGNDLAIAALRAAADDRLPSPKAIGWRGPHWHGLATCPPEAQRQPRCGVCGLPESRCYDRKGIDDDHAFEPVRPVSR